MPTDANLEQLVKVSEDPLAIYRQDLPALKRPLDISKSNKESFVLQLLVRGCQWRRSALTSSYQISGTENLVDNQDNPLPGPFYWMMKHQAWDDFWLLPNMWPSIPQKPICRFVARKGYMTPEAVEKKLKKTPFRWFVGTEKRREKTTKRVNAVLEWLMENTIFITLNRSTGHSNLSEEEQLEKRKADLERLEEISQVALDGKHPVWLPQGTTHFYDGFGDIKGGGHNIIHCKEGDKTYTLPLVFIGNDYDYLCGDFKKKVQRPHLFISFTKPMKYTSVIPEGDEDIDTYKKRDRDNFRDLVRREFMKNHTFTGDQFLSEYVYGQAEKARERGKETFSTSMAELHLLLAKQVDRIGEAKQIHIDSGLLDPGQQFERLENYFCALQVRKNGVDQVPGYGRATSESEVELSVDRILHEAENVRKVKDENILGLQAKRLRTVYNERPDVARVMGYEK